MNKLALFVIAVGAVGCATTERYSFRPMGPVQAGDSGYPASRYQIPAESPRGEAYVTSFGTRELEAGDGARSQLIHVRLAVANNTGDTTWSLDPGQQTLNAPGAAPQRPDFMEIDGKQGTTTAVPRGQRHVFDLYYRVPAVALSAGNLSGFDFNWQVNTGNGAVAERTAFARDVYPDGYGYGPRTHVAVGVGMGPWWAYGYGPGWWGPWGPYGYGYGWYGGYPYGPYYGLGWRGGYYGGYRGYHGGGYGGRIGGGGGGFSRGAIHAPMTRGRPGR